MPGTWRRRRGPPIPPSSCRPGSARTSSRSTSAGHSTLVAHGDPITLTGAHLGHFAALVNANDVATVGADPRWLLTTVLLPPGTTRRRRCTCSPTWPAPRPRSGAPVVGGHTEVTDAVTRPVVSVTALGTVARERLRDKRAVRPGDRVILTKALAVEGTAILAAEAAESLRRARHERGGARPSAPRSCRS